MNPFKAGNYQGYNTGGGAPSAPVVGNGGRTSTPTRTGPADFFIETGEADKAASDFAQGSTPALSAEALGAYRRRDAIKFNALGADGRIDNYVWVTLVNAQYALPSGRKLWDADNGGMTSVNALADGAEGEVQVQSWDVATITVADGEHPELQVYVGLHVPVKHGSKLPLTVDPSSLRLAYNQGTCTIAAGDKKRTFTGGKVYAFVRIRPGITHDDSDGGNAAGWLKARFAVITAQDNPALVY